MFDAASNVVKLCSRMTPGHTHADPLTKESSRKASELLTKNHELYHNRWNAGFHNHLAHHMLSLWSLGATPEQIQDMWDYNEPYQAPIDRYHDQASSIRDLSDDTAFNSCLGQDKYYLDFLEFFRGEIDKLGVPETVRKYVLCGDARANDIHCRMYTDLVHPMIHLGCAIEFEQTSLIAEALAAACAHKNWPEKFILPTEEYTRSNPDLPQKSLLNIIDEMRVDPVISTGVRDDDPFNKIADGLMKRVTGKDFAPLLGQFQVKPTPEDIHRKTAEMMHTCAYIMGAAQRPGKKEKIDFVLLHNATLSVHYPAIMAQDWLTNEEKARILETKARVDAVMYAACGCPELYPERISEYMPQHPQQTWPDLFQRAIVYRDEGHAVKLTRALFALEQHFLNTTGCELPISKHDFRKIAHMSLDSIETSLQPGGTKMPDHVAENVAKEIGKGGEFVVGNMTRWVFYDGLPKAWDNVPDLAATA